MKIKQLVTLLAAQLLAPLARRIEFQPWENHDLKNPND
jgi:hypothetical protein